MRDRKEVMENVRKKIDRQILSTQQKVFGSLTGLIVFMSGAVNTKANENEYDFLKEGTNGNSAIDNVTTNIKSAGYSIYQLFSVLGMIGLGCSIALTAFCLITNKNAQKREENKTQLVWIGAGGILLFGVMTVISMLKSFSNAVAIGSN